MYGPDYSGYHPKGAPTIFPMNLVNWLDSLASRESHLIRCHYIRIPRKKSHMFFQSKERKQNEFFDLENASTYLLKGEQLHLEWNSIWKTHINLLKKENNNLQLARVECMFFDPRLLLNNNVTLIFQPRHLLPSESYLSTWGPAVSKKNGG